MKCFDLDHFCKWCPVKGGAPQIAEQCCRCSIM